MPWRLVLLWLCIALLPLRGWALALPPAAPVHAISHGSAEHAPCHGTASTPAMDGQESAPAPAHAMAHGHAMPADGAAQDHPAAPGTCALCGVCHGMAALPALLFEGFDALPSGTLPAWAPRLSGRLAVHELFRPPRA